MYNSKYIYLRKSKRKLIKKNERKKTFNKIMIALGIIIPICIFFYYGKNIFIYNLDFKVKNIIAKKNKTSTWFQGNITEIINNYFKLYQNPKPETKKFYEEKFQSIGSLKVYSKNDENSTKLLKETFTQKFKKNVSLIKNIFITKGGGFGNQYCALNNIIFYSEILGIKNIYLNTEIKFLFIKDKVTTDKINIELKQQSQVNCKAEDTFCGHIFFDFYFPLVFKPTARNIILKDELKKNLPKLKIDKNDLYIHIRAGDVFEKRGNSYSPPPYCFYQKVLKQFKFKKIYLISMDDKSPIIGKLMSDYPNIVHELHPIEHDIACLMNAYNIVNSISSFAQVSISFNDYIENLWEYDFYKINEKIFHFHHDFERLNRQFNIYRMKPSENYIKQMFDWRNEESQKKFMFEETCIYDFEKTKSTELIF